MLKIYVPSRGRPNKQIFFDALPAGIQAHTTLVVREDEAHLYQDYPFVKSPNKHTHIGQKRDWILHHHHNIAKWGARAVMCDDDLRIAKRRKDDPTKFEKMEAEDYFELFDKVEDSLNKYGHITMLPREGGNRHTSGDFECGRAMRFLGYNIRTLANAGAYFADIPTKEDFHVTLRLLMNGHPNLVITDFVQDDGGGSNAPGGCSVYRDLACMENDANMLKAMYPDFVKVVQKTTKGAWGGGTRTDVQIQWKEAYKSSQRGGLS